ncbi:uncharacterized protein [Halyomorpha halys]|uniref:uncharacterized protein n=1 Tax=Halyomorpha halys TaxID=286706 RepID=UPI0006D50DC3|nr:uncharacterized protein LOC106691343 [Halyomorpha halys]
MADPESCLKNALCTVSVHADSVWWHEAKDKYRLANLNLWLHVLRTQSQPPEPHLDYQDDRTPATCRCPKKSLQEVELPEEMIPDPEAWLKGHSWPTAIARNFPAISIALVGEHSFCRGLGPSLGNYLVLKYSEGSTHPLFSAQLIIVRTESSLQGRDVG